MACRTGFSREGIDALATKVAPTADSRFAIDAATLKHPTPTLAAVSAFFVVFVGARLVGLALAGRHWTLSRLKSFLRPIRDSRLTLQPWNTQRRHWQQCRRFLLCSWERGRRTGFSREALDALATKVAPTADSRFAIDAANLNYPTPTLAAVSAFFVVFVGARLELPPKSWTPSPAFEGFS